MTAHCLPKEVVNKDTNRIWLEDDTPHCIFDIVNLERLTSVL
jgi:hypothetical protein